jgi:hypothetical protein
LQSPFSIVGKFDIFPLLADQIVHIGENVFQSFAAGVFCLSLAKSFRAKASFPGAKDFLSEKSVLFPARAAMQTQALYGGG